MHQPEMDIGAFGIGFHHDFNFSTAFKLYKKALELEPDWDEGWWNLGSIQYDRDNFAERTPAFERLAALKPDAALSWTMAGRFVKAV